MTSQIRREPTRRNADSRRARTMSVQRADELSYPFIWDARAGGIAWEGTQELRHAHDTMSEEPIMLRTVLERTARDLIARLP